MVVIRLCGLDLLVPLTCGAFRLTLVPAALSKGGTRAEGLLGLAAALKSRLPAERRAASAAAS